MSISDAEKGTADSLATRLGLTPGAEAVSGPERQVRGERVRLMAERSTHESVLAAAFALAAAALLWPAADPLPLLAWLALTQLPSAARTLVGRSYRRMPSDVSASRHPYWAHRFSACSAASGAVWGGVVVLLPPAGSVEIALLIGLHAAYLALAAGILTAWLPAFLGFALPSTLAFLAIAADAVPVQGAALLIVAGAGSLLGAHVGARSLVDALRVRLDHEERAVRLVAERERAELALEAGRRVLAVARHDLRQPVMALELYASSLRSKVRGTEADAVAARIERSIRALSAMIDSVLDVSTLDANGIEEVPDPVALAPLLARVVLDHELQARAKGLSLSIEGRTDLVAAVDPVRLGRVLMNLVGNAIKFTGHGGVVVAVRPDGERVSLSVRDTGRGIAAGEQQRVFAEYHQSRRSDRAAGQGLGLAIVKRLCDQMDVSIELVSAPGAGSEFRLSIPRGTAGEIETDGGRRPDGDERVAQVAVTRMPVARPRKPRASIPGCRQALLVDAERDSLDATRTMLAGWGCRATTGRSAAEAVRRHVHERDDVPDVLILDVGRRSLAHGLEDALSVREEFNVDIPVVLIADETSADEPMVIEEGVRVLCRPCAPAHLRLELTALVAAGVTAAA